jgi:integrase
MSVVTRGNKFQANVCVNGVRRRKSFDTKADAELYELQVRQALLTGKDDPDEVLKKAERLNITKAADRCYKMHWVGSKSESMQAKMIAVLCRELGPDTELKNITSRVLEDYVLDLKAKRKSNGTINRRLACLSKILRTAQRSGYIEAMPYIPRQKEGQNRMRWLTWDEEDSLLAVMDQWGLAKLKDAFIVSIDTGIRAGELNGITPKDIMKEGLHIPVSKNGAPRVVPLTQRARAVLVSRSHNLGRDDRLFEGSRLWYRDQWDRVKTHLGLEDVVWHTLRHTTCSRLIQGGMPLTHAKEWMGHKAIQTTLRYAHLAPSHLDGGLSLLNRDSVAGVVA